MNIVIGDPKAFAVEYNLDLEVMTKYKNTQRRFGALILWFDNSYLGDIRYTTFFGGAIHTLYFLKNRPTDSGLRYQDELQVPEFMELVDYGGWSINESFDDFAKVYYWTENTAEVHFKWMLWDSPNADFGNYPKGIHHARIPYQIYDHVIGELISALYPDGYE